MQKPRARKGLRLSKQPGDNPKNAWPTGQVQLKVCGSTVSECVTRHIRDYPEDEQQRMLSLFRKIPLKEPVASAYSDKQKQKRRARR